MAHRYVVYLLKASRDKATFVEALGSYEARKICADVCLPPLDYTELVSVRVDYMNARDKALFPHLFKDKE